MAYNNGFPIGYQQQYYPQYYIPSQYQMPQTASPQGSQSSYVQAPEAATQNGGMTWVQGIGGAKSYLVAPNATVVLWDSEAPVIYLKSADSSGMPSMKILDYSVRETQQNNIPPVTEDKNDYATRTDISGLRDEIEKVKARLDSLYESHPKHYKNDRRDTKNE